MLKKIDNAYSSHQALYSTMYTITYLFTPTVYTYLSTRHDAERAQRREALASDAAAVSALPPRSHPCLSAATIASLLGVICRHELCAIEPVIEPVPSPVIVSLWRQRVRSFR